MKHLFIVNPTAGDRDSTQHVREIVGKAFAGREDEYEIYVTRCPMDAPEKIHAEAKNCEHLRVYACGGDGTFNECVCGAAELENVAVCPFPTGTGNDFCRMFGDEGALFKDLEALLDGWETPIDLINCNGRWCANICSVGIDARIGADVHKYSKLPLIGGAAGYVVSAVVNLIKGINRNMYVKAGDFYREGKHALVCACNGRFYGGGFNPSNTARPDDGLLDLIVVRDVSLFMVPLLIGKYAAGRVDELPKYARHFVGTEIEIGFDEPNIVNIDGETIYTDKAIIRLVKDCAKLVVPKGMRFFDKKEAKEPALV